MNGYERLKKLYYQSQNKNKPLIEIIKYLLSQPDMSNIYLKEEKNLNQMMIYINKKAKELAYQGVSIVLDEEVFKWAFDYFNLSDEELGINEKTDIKIPKIEKVKSKSEDENVQLSLGDML